MEEFDNFVKVLNKLIKASPEVYINKEIEGEEIYSKLKEINIWLLGKMEKNDMFGKKKKKLEGL